MDQQKKDKIVECIKYLCDTKKMDVNFDELEIDFEISGKYIFSNQFLINDFVKITNKIDSFCFWAGGNSDEQTIAYYALKGYLKQKDKFIKKKQEQEAKEKYKKEHPFLSRLKEFKG